MFIAYRPMDYNIEPRNKSLCIWLNDARHGYQDNSMREKTVFSTNGVRKTGYLHAKE